MDSFKFILGVLLLALATAVGALTIISFKHNEASNQTAYSINVTRQVLNRIHEISALSKDLQLESNAYFISRDSSLIMPYYHARALIMIKVHELRSLTSNHPGQQKKIDSLEFVLNDLTAFADSVLDSQKTNYSENTSLNRVARNKVHRQEIRKIISQIQAEEESLLIKSVKANTQSIEAFKRSFILAQFVIAILLATMFLTIRRNFNKRIRVEKELKRANELFEKLFYESPIGIVISDAKSGKILDCNNRYADMFNIRRLEALGKTAVDLKIATKEQREDALKNASAGGIVRDVELELCPRYRTPIWVSVSIQSIIINSKECLISAMLDMTVHKKAVDEIKKALETEMRLNKMKSSFVTLASHEFRTPLTTIKSSAFIIEQYLKEESNEKIRKHITRIKNCVDSLTSILDEFLSITIIDEGEVIPKLQKLDLKDYLQGKCIELKSITKPGQQIICSYDGARDFYSDPVLLGNILTNLISNAIKYSPENAEIFVSSVVNKYACISVKDPGIGIPKGDQKHLFERFYRASNAGNVQGTGLGLHIMKHYLNLLNGTVRFQSEEGKGTEFIVTLDSGVNRQGRIASALPTVSTPQDPRLN